MFWPPGRRLGLPDPCINSDTGPWKALTCTNLSYPENCRLKLPHNQQSNHLLNPNQQWKRPLTVSLGVVNLPNPLHGLKENEEKTLHDPKELGMTCTGLGILTIKNQKGKNISDLKAFPQINSTVTVQQRINSWFNLNGSWLWTMKPI